MAFLINISFLSLLVTARPMVYSALSNKLQQFMTSSTGKTCHHLGAGRSLAWLIQTSVYAPARSWRSPVVFPPKEVFIRLQSIKHLIYIVYWAIDITMLSWMVKPILQHIMNHIGLTWIVQITSQLHINLKA